jgi:septal ring factor EnvC (AmiA/AmiB activator)
MTTLKQLDAKLQAQALEVANLRAALDVQFKRIAQMQAELDVLPTARERRKFIRAQLDPPSHNGNGHVLVLQEHAQRRARSK